MAAYTVRVTVNSGGLISLTNSSGTDGESFGTPLELNAGDTVTFDGFSIATNRSATISGLAIFTNNNNVSITSNASSVTRTVASGSLLLDTVTGTSDLFETDFFYFERQAASIVAPTSTSVTTETQAINTATVAYDVTFNLSNAGSGGTYEYAIEQGDSTPDNWTAMPSDTATSVTVSFNRTDNPGTIYAQARRSTTDVSVIRSVAGLAFWPPADISVSSVTISSDFAASYSATIIGGYYPGSPYEAYAVADITGLASSQIFSTAIDRLSPYTGQQFEIPSAELPTSGSTKTYYLYRYRYNTSPDRGGAGVWIEGNSFTITRAAAPSGTISFTGGSSQTEGSGTLGFSFSNTVDGTYYYDVNRISGSVGGGEITNPGPSSVVVSGGTGTVNLNFINDTTSEIGFQGEQFVMRYGTTSNSEDLDTLNFTLYDDDTGISYSDSTVDIVSGATSHTVGIVRAAGDSSTAVTARVRNVTTNTVIGSTFSLATGTTNRSVADAPDAGDTETFRVEVFNGNEYINGPTYTVTRDPVPTAPTSITFEADQNVSAADITQAVTISGGANGTIEYSENNSTWFTYSGPTDFTFTRNVSKTIYARRNDGSQTSSVSQSSKTYGYFTGDPSAEVSIDRSSISANYTGSVFATVTGGSVGTRYRLYNTTGLQGAGNTGDGNGVINIGDVANELPDKGETDSYKLQYKVIEAEGGDNILRDVSPSQTFTIERTNDIPNAFTLDTLTNRALNTEVVDSAQITGITQEAVVSRTAGTGTFAVGGATEPSAGSFSTADKTITNNQYVWVKDTTSGTASTTKSTTIAVGTGSPQSATFSYTTAAGGDITVSITYDQESGSFLPAPSFSPVVSGQNGLSNAQARELTAGTDVVFENVSDPGAPSVTIASLNKFTNNTSISLAQGQSVTRTWATGQLGNTVDEVSLSAGTVGDFIYFKQPAVAPDLDVTPVSPANRAFNDTAAFNVTVNDVTSGETYKITENNFTTSLGSATASGTSVTISMTIGNAEANTYGNLGVGQTKTYEIHASRPSNLGGTGSFVQTDDTFTVTRNVETVTTPTAIAFSPASTVSKSTNVTVDVTTGSGGTAQIRLGSGDWLDAPQTYNLTRGTTYSFSARRLGSQGASVTGTYVESYQVPYLSPDSSVSVIVTTTIAANAGSQTVRIQNGNSIDEYQVSNTAGTVDYGTRTGDGNVTLSDPSELPTSGSSLDYRIRARRPTDSGGSNSFVNATGTNSTFTITRSAPTAPTVNIAGDPGTRSQSVSLAVTASGGNGDTLQVSENNSTFVTNGTSFEFRRGTPKTVYARGVTDGTASTSSSSSKTLSYIAPDTAITLALSSSSISPGATANITASFTGGTEGDIVDLRTNDTNTPLASGTSVGTATFNSSGNASLTVSSGEQPDVQGTTAQYRAYVQTPESLGGDANYDATSETAGISRRAFTAPNSIQFPSDPGTLSDSVSLTVTIAGGAEGSLQISEDNTTWFTATSRAFEFTRNSPKTIYARRIDGTQVSSVTSSSFTLSYLPPNSGAGVSPSTTSITAGFGGTVTVAITGATSQDFYRIVTTDTNTPQASGHVVDSFTGTTASSFTIANNELPDVLNTSAGYRVEVRRPFGSGGDNEYDTVDTFSISRGTISQPTSIQFPSDPGTLSDSVSLTVTIAGGSGGSLEISENNSTWFTQASKAFEFTRSDPKTIYARRNDNGTLSSVTQSSFTLPYLAPDTTIGITPSTTSITAGFGGTVTVAITGATTQDEYRLVTTDANTPQTSGHVVDSFTGTTASSFTIANNELPDIIDTSAGYRVEVRRPIAVGGDNQYDTAGTFSISRGNLTAPTSIQFPSDPGTASKSVSLTVTISGGTGGNLQISENNSTWITAGSQAFEFTRNVAKTIYARRNDNGTVSSVTQSSFTLPFLAGDGNVTVTVSNSSIAYLSSTDQTVDITNGASNTQYRIVNNATPSTIYDTITGNGTLTLTDPGELPGANSSIQYRLQFARTTASGGSGSFATATPATFTISRSAQDLVPDGFSFTDKTGVNQNTDQISSVQITGINDTAVASVTQNNGQGVFAVTSSATPPNTGYSSATKNITNNQYLHAKVTSSNTLGGTVSSTFAVGSVSDNFNVTTTSAQASYYTVQATYSYETDILSFNVSPVVDGRTGQASNTAVLLNPGDIVDFNFDIDPATGTGTFNSFTSPYWTNTSNLTLASGVTGSRTWSTSNNGGDADSVGISIQGNTDTVFFTTAYPGPDTSVTFDECVQVAANAASHQITITDTGDSTNSASSVYVVGTDSRTGPGALTVNSVPTFLGQPTTYTLKARLPVAAGGDNSLKDVGQYTVVRGNAPGANPPGIDTYGIAIYDDQGTFVTSFTGGSSVLREITEGTTQITTSGVKTVSTGITGLSSGNALVAITLDTGTESTSNEGAARGLPYRFINDGASIEFAQSTTTQSVKYTVYQYKQETKGASGLALDYGIEIRNGDGDIVLDNYASTYAVSEIINCATSNSNVTAYDYGEYSWVVVELTEGDYPLSGGLPVPAIQGPNFAQLFNAKFSGITYSNSWRKVEFWAKTSQFGNGSNWNLAILTEKNNTTPSFYGSSVNDYGFQVYDESGNVQWDSNYQQSILNNVIDSNQFTTGSSKNGTYDVSTGFDGAIQPVAAATSGQSELNFSLYSTAGYKSVTLPNEIDPANTFLLGGYFFTGSVRYYKGRLFIPDTVPPTDQIIGGGTHLPCISLTSNTTATLGMPRIFDGPSPPTTNDRCQRVPTSHHPDGKFVLVRIT